MSFPIVNLGSISSKIDYGLTASAVEREGEPRFLRITDLQNDSVNWTTVPSCECSPKDIDQYKLENGDIVFARTGATTGKSYLINNLEIDAVFASYLIRVRPNSDTDALYLSYFFKSSKYWHQITSMANGAAQPGVNSSKLKELEVPMPPLPEQQRIAAILDKADAIRRKRQQAIQLADEFLRSVFLEMFGDPVTNPKGWEVKPLKDVALIQIGPFGTQLHKEDYISGGIPLINPIHIIDGKIAPKNDLTISIEKHAELPEYHLKVDDIIMGRRGEMGRCALVTDRESGWLCGTGSLFIRPYKPNVFSEYLQRFLSTDAMKNHLESEALGATMPNLNKTIVGNIQVPIPSDDSLTRFAKIKQSFLKMQASSLNFGKNDLFNALSQRAFAGEL